jgi:hypothetical protein
MTGDRCAGDASVPFTGFPETAAVVCIGSIVGVMKMRTSSMASTLLDDLKAIPEPVHP